MTTFGFRAEKDVVHFAITNGTAESPVCVDSGKFSAPKTYSFNESLAWYRERLQALVAQHNPKRAHVRLSETFLQHKPKPNILESMFARCRIEGVILEALASKNVDVVGGKLQQISSGLGTKTAKRYLEVDEVRGMDWSKIKNTKTREAILAAISVLGD